MKNSRLLLVSTLMAIALMTCSHAYATTDSARAYSVYFSEATDTGTGDVDNFYARCWGNWLRYHRAIEKTPMLRHQILRLPKDPYEGRKGVRQLMYKQLSTKFIRSQPTNVYVLQLGAYRTRRGIAAFMKQYWSKVNRKYIYEKTRKDFMVEASSEANSKPEPIFLMPGKGRVRRLCYGIYASRTDAERDAGQFKRYLGYKPILLQRPLTAQLAHSFIFAPVLDYYPKLN